MIKIKVKVEVIMTHKMKPKNTFKLRLNFLKEKRKE